MEADKATFTDIEAFKKGLSSALNDVKPSNNELHKTLNVTTMMMDELIKFTARLIVVTSSGIVHQLLLEKDQEALLRRDLEDYLTEVTDHALKKHVLDIHVDYTKFKQKRSK